MLAAPAGWLYTNYTLGSSGEVGSMPATAEGQRYAPLGEKTMPLSDMLFDASLDIPMPKCKPPKGNRLGSDGDFLIIAPKGPPEYGYYHSLTERAFLAHNLENFKKEHPEVKTDDIQIYQLRAR